MMDWKQVVLFTLNLLLYLLCKSPTLANETPPRFVYRADFREPSIIFRDGFQPLGDNWDLMEHVTGNSCNAGSTKDSAFVATTSDEAFAVKYGLGLLWTTPGAAPFMYIYTIRATEYFYEAERSLRKVYKATGARAYESMADLYEAEKEWAAYKGILRSLIKSVKVYKKGAYIDNPGEFVREEENELFVAENTRGNADAFPVNGLVEEVNLVASNSPDPVSACFASCPPSNSARFSSGGACQMKQIVYKTNLANEKGTFWDSMKWQRVEGLLPWKETTTNEGGHTIEKPEHCIINTDGPGHTLQINCPRNRFYERFRVYLRGGMGSGPRALFYSKHKEGVAGRTWRKSARQIRMFAGGNLEEKGYTMTDVFANRYGIWWSQIHIYPVYPIIRS